VADTLTQCELLETLVLANNRLTWLPKDFGSLSRIKLLDLRCNSLESVPESICHIATLEILDLRINELKELPVNIGNCSVCHSPIIECAQGLRPVCVHLSARSLLLAVTTARLCGVAFAWIPSACHRGTHGLSLSANRAGECPREPGCDSQPRLWTRLGLGP
jgi:hypothetical protein